MLFGINVKKKIAEFLDNHAEDIGESLEKHLKMNADLEDFKFIFSATFGGYSICHYELDLEPLIKQIVKEEILLKEVEKP